MTTYRGDFARLYDTFHRDKAYEAEAVFVDRILRRHSDGPHSSLLDVACGTGSHAAAFSRLGWRVVGVDQSPEMIEVARSRNPDAGVTFIQQDMRDLVLDGQMFDAAVCLFDSIGYVITNESVIMSLKGIRRHLRPGGLVVLEFWHSVAMVSAYDDIRVREWEAPEQRVLRIARTQLDVVSQTARVEYHVLGLRADGTYVEWHETHHNRYFSVPEMDQLLRSAGFEPLDWHRGFQESRQIDGSTWHVVVTARASSPATE